MRSRLVTLCFGTVLGPWSESRGARRLRSLFVAPVALPTIPPPGNPSKEYIYAGGKLIATEEPAPLAAPLNLSAETLSSSQVNITWTASPGADHYQVQRTANIGTAYEPVAYSVTTTSFSDTSVISGSAYLYRVVAVGSSSNVSPPSNIDLATAITFLDDPLQAGTTPIKAQHITEMRQAVDAVRAAANQGGAGWTDSSLSGATIKAIHIQELRTNLDQALSALGLNVGLYTDATLSGMPIKKVHLDEIRLLVK